MKKISAQTPVRQLLKLVCSGHQKTFFYISNNWSNFVLLLLHDQNQTWMKTLSNNKDSKTHVSLHFVHINWRYKDDVNRTNNRFAAGALRGFRQKIISTSSYKHRTSYIFFFLFYGAGRELQHPQNVCVTYRDTDV